MKIRLLFFVDRLGHGGIQTLLLNILNNIDKERFEISFLCFKFNREYELEEPIRAKGYKIYKVTHPQKNIFRCLKETKVFFEEHKFDILHCHSSSKSAILLAYAKRNNVKVRIAHSHCTKFQTKDPIKKIIGNFLMIFTRKYATHYAACSDDAAKWMFGKNNFKKGKVRIIKNAIELSKYKFSLGQRTELRKKYRVDDSTLVVGHVGRFMNQKNHIFLINSFSQLIQLGVDAKLFLIGTGELMNVCLEKVNELGLANKVIFAGYQVDVNDYYSMFDVFALPSLFEGLPFVGIEAQASGLPCVFSENISEQIIMSKELCYFVDLSLGTNAFANVIFSIKDLKYDRKLIYDRLKTLGYDINDEIILLEDYYLSSLNYKVGV